MKELIEKRKELELKNARLAKVFEEAGAAMDMKKVKCIEGSSREKAAKIKEWNDELSAIGEDVNRLAVIEKAADETRRRDEVIKTAVRGVVHPGTDGAAGPKGHLIQPKSIGQMFIESKAYKDRAQGVSDELGIELKTLMETTAGWAPEVTRTGRVVEAAQRPVQVAQVFPVGATGQPSVKYMEETTFTSGAAEAAEGGAYGESALALMEKTSPVQKIATYLPITDEQLEDEARVQSYVDNRLRFMLEQRLDGQVLTGNGTSPNLRGLLNVSGIQSQAKGADPVADAIYKAMTKVRVTGRANPTAVIIHPNDWQEIRLLRTADGVYIWGSPSETGPEKIWGLPVVQSDAETENTAVVGDFLVHSELVSRSGITVKVSDSHSDYFVKGKQAIRADIRVALIFYRPAAFCTVTGI